MINYTLPLEIEIDGALHPIRNKGDYRMTLDVIAALNDDELDNDKKIRAALFIFYEDVFAIENLEEAAKKMMCFINDGEEEDKEDFRPPIMDWQQDFKLMVAPINRALGFEIRSVPYLHWWTFLSGYKEIGKGTFQTVIAIRDKRRKGQKLEKWESDFYKENRKLVDLPLKLTSEQLDYLDF